MMNSLASRRRGRQSFGLCRGMIACLTPLTFTVPLRRVAAPPPLGGHYAGAATPPPFAAAAASVNTASERSCAAPGANVNWFTSRSMSTGAGGGGVAAVDEAYELVSHSVVDEFQARATLYRHRRSGAQVLSVEKDDKNKVFGITFRTPVDDSMGIPHILEHSVLCGSRKYPVKEPFVELLKGSLQTFLNAFTYPDRTCYPVASQNLKDFYNLVDVYLDAVFYPRAKDDPSVLAQEGWHLEQEAAGEPLKYKGVVYNEMKGVYSQPTSLLHKLAYERLFPSTTYRHDSGGDPAAIPGLNFDAFRDFHSAHYHPSNSRIYFYGDDDPAQRLRLLDEYLRDFDVSSSSSSSNNNGSQVDWQPKLLAPSQARGTYPVSPDEPDPKTYAAMTWVLNDTPLSEKDQLALSVLNHLLLGSQASVLHKELLESGLGESVTGGGVSGELLQHTFSIGLKGMKTGAAATMEEEENGNEAAAALEGLVLGTLRKLADEGFEPEAIDASMNQVEFDLREFNVGGFPKGLALMLGAVRPWIYDQDPIDGLRFEQPLAELKSDLASGRPVFQELVRDILVDNPHRITVALTPDVEAEARTAAEEEARLAAVRQSMTDSDLDSVRDEAAKLREAQAAEDPPEARATIPSLSLSDLDRKEQVIPVDVDVRPGNVHVLEHDQSTSGILYADVAFDASAVALEDLPLLTLLTRMLTDVGTDHLDRVAFDRHVNSRTGGVGCSLSLYEPSRFAPEDDGTVVVGARDKVKPYVVLGGKAVASRVPDLFDILEMCINRVALDQRPRVVEMLRETKARLESRVLSSGNAVAAGRISGVESLKGFVSEQLGGLPRLDSIKELLAKCETDDGWAEILQRLESLRTLVFATSRDGVIISLTGDKATVLDPSRDRVDVFIAGLPPAADAGSGTKKPASRVPEWAEAWRAHATAVAAGEAGGLREGIVVPTQVNYVARSAAAFDEGERINGQAMVVQSHLQTGHLWEQVRVIGGAYGASCSLSGASGSLRCVSYRDPNLVQTYDAFGATADALIADAEHMADADIEAAIIGTIGDMDGPMSADQKGAVSMTRYIRGESNAARQRWREAVLSTTREDFKEFGHRLKAAFAASKGQHVVVVGSKAAFEDPAAQPLALSTRSIFSSDGESPAGAGVVDRS